MKVVADNKEPTDELADIVARRARAALEKVLAQKPVNLVILFETEKQYDYETPSGSKSAAMGLISGFYNAFEAADDQE